MPNDSHVLAGLGNPGPQYAGTRHNAGFIFVDWLAARHRAGFAATRQQALSARIILGGASVHLLKPQSFMNRSGAPVAEFLRYFGLSQERLVVVHDDIDMHSGRVKLVSGGGTGGHNGIRSITGELGSADFFRLKIGIGRPGGGSGHPDMEVERYVLSRFSDEEMDHIRSRFEEMEAGLEHLCRGETARAMTRINMLK